MNDGGLHLRGVNALARSPHGAALLRLDDEGLGRGVVVHRRVVGDAREARHVLALQVGVVAGDTAVVVVDGEEGCFI